MHDTHLVRPREALGHLDGHVQGLTYFESAASELLFERLAGIVGHCNEQLPVVFANVVDGADVLMVEGGGSLGLLHETLFGSGALAQVRREKFQRDGTVQAGVTGLIHNAHAATSELAEDLIVGDGFPES